MGWDHYVFGWGTSLLSAEMQLHSEQWKKSSVQRQLWTQAKQVFAWGERLVRRMILFPPFKNRDPESSLGQWWIAMALVVACTAHSGLSSGHGPSILEGGRSCHRTEGCWNKGSSLASSLLQLSEAPISAADAAVPWGDAQSVQATDCQGCCVFVHLNLQWRGHLDGLVFCCYPAEFGQNRWGILGCLW